MRTELSGAGPAHDSPLPTRASLDGRLKPDEMIAVRIGLNMVMFG